MLSKFWLNMSLRSKLRLIVALSCSTALLLAGPAFIMYDRIDFKRSMVTDMEVLADILGSNSTAAIVFNNRQDALEMLAGLKAEEHIISAAIMSAEGEILADYQRSDQSSPAEAYPLERQSHEFHSEFLTVHRDIVLEGERIGSVFLRVDLEELSTRLGRFGTAVIIVILVSFCVALLVISRLQKVISEPVQRLSDIAGEVSESKDYSVRAEVQSNDEVGFLVKMFNGMLEQIQNRDRELQNINSELEDRVKDRTSELEAEIAERKEAEARTRQSLAEKEVLLKEVHHRVKNNLQIITSLLNLQAGKVSDPRTQSVIRDSQSRVKSMSLIHEMLYQSETLAEISLRDYIASLVTYLLSSVSGNRGRISVDHDIDDITVGVDTAVPCGLVLNELVTNSLKYAFPEERAGVIRISCRQIEGQRIRLTVQDDGVGFEVHPDLGSPDTLGLQLVSSLTAQLGGTVKMETDKGTTFALEFKCRSVKRKKAGDNEPESAPHEECQVRS